MRHLPFRHRYYRVRSWEVPNSFGLLWVSVFTPAFMRTEQRWLIACDCGRQIVVDAAGHRVHGEKLPAD